MSVARYDVQVEQDLLGSMLHSPEYERIGLALVLPEDFYVPLHQSIHAAIGRLHEVGGTITPTTIGEDLKRCGLDPAECAAAALQMMVTVPSPSGVAYYAEVVVRDSVGRRVQRMAIDLAQSIQNGADPYDRLDAHLADCASISVPIDESKIYLETITDILAASDIDSPWIIPGLLRQDWRAVLVAPEGVGKSVVLRQIAMMTAQGIHPFRMDRFAPVRTLVVDLENPRASIGETGGRIHHQLQRTLGDDYDDRRCIFYRRPMGIDLLTRHDCGELEALIKRHRPGLVTIGPIYKMLNSKPGQRWEEFTDPVLRVLDDLRSRYGFAILMEHHAAKATGGSRDMNPYGSQRWMAWPEIGLKLIADQPGTWNLGRFRGDRMKTHWPDQLTHGGAWPWSGIYRQPPEEEF